MAGKLPDGFLRNLLYLDITTLVVDEVPTEDARPLREKLDALIPGQNNAERAATTTSRSVAESGNTASLAEIRRRIQALMPKHDPNASAGTAGDLEAIADEPSPSEHVLRERVPSLLQAIEVLESSDKKLALDDKVTADELRAVMKLDHLVALGAYEVQVRTRINLFGDVVTWVKRDTDGDVTEVHQHSVQSAVGWWGTLLNTAVSVLDLLFRLIPR
jgi:hypothetical protein